MDNRQRRQREELPSQCAYVADDILALCKPRAGIWLDVGTGPGGLALALPRQLPGTVLVLMDPNPKALGKALQAAGIASLFVAFPRAIVGAMMLLVGIELFKFAKDLRRDRSLIPVAVTVLGSVEVNMAAGFVAGLLSHYLFARNSNGTPTAGEGEEPNHDSRRN